MKRSLFISTVAMAVVMVMALSTATYAWFTVSGTVVTNTLDFTAESTENLEISLDNVTYGTSVTMVNNIIDQMWPVSMSAYTPGSYTFTEDNEGAGSVITPIDEVFSEEIWLRSSSAMAVYLDATSFIMDDAAENVDGAIDLDQIIGAVRLAIFDQDNTLLFVWAPNANILLTESGNITVVTDSTTNTNTADSAANSYLAPYGGTGEPNFIQNTGYYPTADIPVINLAAGVSQKITVIAWIEGTDNEAHNALSGGKFDIYLAFEGA